MNIGVWSYYRSQQRWHPASASGQMTAAEQQSLDALNTLGTVISESGAVGASHEIQIQRKKSTGTILKLLRLPGTSGFERKFSWRALVTLVFVKIKNKSALAKVYQTERRTVSRAFAALSYAIRAVTLLLLRSYRSDGSLGRHYSFYRLAKGDSSLGHPRGSECQDLVSTNLSAL